MAKYPKEVTQKYARLGLIAAFFLVILLGCLLAGQWPSGLDMHEISTSDLGTVLFEDYGIAFLVVGVVLFVSMMGGVFLAHDEEESK